MVKDNLSTVDFLTLYSVRKYDDFENWIVKHKYLLLVNFLSIMFSLVMGQSLLVAALRPFV